MNLTSILISAAVIAAVGLIVGLGLGIFGNKFKVEKSARETLIRKELPGNNCGGCGYPGCDSLAKAINEGLAGPNACPVGGMKVGSKIAEILGIESVNAVRKVAYVRCNGTCDAISVKSVYYGIKDCSNAVVVPGGAEKACRYGCWGYGSCVKACQFDAIHIINGVAVVDPEKCTSCGKCTRVCPNGLIELVPYDAQYHVTCMSREKGRDVMQKCKNGCIGCGICTKQCESAAVSLENNLARIDYEKCISCGKCAEKCPKHIIL